MIKKIVFGTLAVAAGVYAEKKLNLAEKVMELFNDLMDKSDEWVDDDEDEEDEEK